MRKDKLLTESYPEVNQKTMFSRSCYVNHHEELQTENIE